MDSEYVEFMGRQYPRQRFQNGEELRLCEFKDAPPLDWLIYADTSGEIHVIKPSSPTEFKNPRKTLRSDGYYMVSFAKKQRKDNGDIDYHQVRVHEVVLTAFIGPRPDGYVGKHKNDDPSDNRLCNLEWGSQSENAEERHAHSQKGTTPQLNKVKVHISKWVVDELRKLSGNKTGPAFDGWIENLLIHHWMNHND